MFGFPIVQGADAKTESEHQTQLNITDPFFWYSNNLHWEMQSRILKMLAFA
jgi:hypothetical protein